MLREINRIIAEEDINVLGQYLGTNEAVGYVVLDIAKDVSNRLVDGIGQIPGTLRCRVLF